MRYFSIEKPRVAEHIKNNDRALWLECRGDHGTIIEEGLRKLGDISGLDHNGVELYIDHLIRARAQETNTVSSDCLAVQIDMSEPKGHVQVTLYSKNGPTPLIAPWVLMPRMICAPSAHPSNVGVSKCGKYVEGGFSDGFSNLHIKTRIPVENRQEDSDVIVFDTLQRPPTE